MSRHKTARDAVNRIMNSDSAMAVFHDIKPYKFRVLFADCVLTQRHIKTKLNFITVVGKNCNPDSVEQLLRTLE